MSKNQPGNKDYLAKVIRQAERLVVMERNFPAFLKGEFQPKDNTERLDLITVCQGKRRNHAAARLCADAFAADPKLADDLEAGHRYNAACFALLAASGEGEDAARLDDNERARLRKQALGWLRADTLLYTRKLESGQPVDRIIVEGRMRHWRQDTDLASIRDEAARSRLPEAERNPWQALWGEVEALLKSAEGKTP